MRLWVSDQRPNTSKPAPGQIFPYLLKEVEVNRVKPSGPRHHLHPHGEGPLVAIMDWHSQHVLAWKLSNTVDTSFCVAALEEALGKGRGAIQHRPGECSPPLPRPGARIRSTYLGQHLRGAAVQVRGGVSESFIAEARTGCLEFYNRQRPHQALGTGPQQRCQLARKKGEQQLKSRAAIGLGETNAQGWETLLI